MYKYKMCGSYYNQIYEIENTPEKELKGNVYLIFEDIGTDGYCFIKFVDHNMKEIYRPYLLSISTSKIGIHSSVNKGVPLYRINNKIYVKDVSCD